MLSLRHLVVYFGIATLIAIVAVVGLVWHWDGRQVQTSAGEALIGGPFTLIDQHGARVTEQDFAGRFMLVYFGYTFCPDICPTSLTVMAAALDQLPEAQAEQVVPILITVDPARDTVEQLADYAPLFHPRLVALTGSEEEVREAARAYRVYYHVPEEERRRLPGRPLDLRLSDGAGWQLSHPFRHRRLARGDGRGDRQGDRGERLSLSACRGRTGRLKAGLHFFHP